jgi:hypothetical protein
MLSFSFFSRTQQGELKPHLINFIATKTHQFGVRRATIDYELTYNAYQQTLSNVYWPGYKCKGIAVFHVQRYGRDCYSRFPPTGSSDSCKLKLA